MPGASNLGYSGAGIALCGIKRLIMPDRIYSYVPLWGEWEIDSFIGEGSYGRVYKAVKSSDGSRQISAVKIIHIPVSEEHAVSLRSNDMDDSEIRSFYSDIAEKCVSDIINIGSRKGLANIAGAEDCAVFEDETGFGWDILIRTEYLMPLKKYIAGTELTVRDVVKIGQDISNAVVQLNKLSMIHSDIKPENIFVSQFGSFKLADYGIAKNLRKILGTGINEQNTYYMAPELYNRNTASLSSDIYSLSVLMYRLLNKNRIPFMPDYPVQAEPSDRDEAVRKRMNGEFIPLLPSDTGRKLSSVLAAALSFDTSVRFKSAEEFKEELTKIALFEPGLDKLCTVGPGSSLYEYRSPASLRSAAGAVSETPDADYPLIRKVSDEDFGEKAVIIQEEGSEDIVSDEVFQQDQAEELAPEEDAVLNSSDMNGIFAGMNGDEISTEDAEGVFELLKPQEVLSAAGSNADFSNKPFGFSETEPASEYDHDHSDTAERQYYGLFSDKSNEEDENTFSGTDADTPDSDMDFGTSEIHPADDKVTDLDNTESDKDSGSNEDIFGEDIQEEDTIIDYAEEIEFSSPFDSEPDLVFDGLFEEDFDSESGQADTDKGIQTEELNLHEETPAADADKQDEPAVFAGENEEDKDQAEELRDAQSEEFVPQEDISADYSDEQDETDVFAGENEEDEDQAEELKDAQPEEFVPQEETSADYSDEQDGTDVFTGENEEDNDQAAAAENAQPEEFVSHEDIPADYSDEQDGTDAFGGENEEDKEQAAAAENAQPEEFIFYEETPADSADDKDETDVFVTEESEETSEQTDSGLPEIDADEYQEEDADAVLPVFEPEIAEIPALDELESESFISMIPTLNTGVLEEIISTDGSAASDAAEEDTAKDDETKPESFDIESSLDLLKLSELYTSVPEPDEYDLFSLAEEAKNEEITAEPETEKEAQPAGTAETENNADADEAENAESAAEADVTEQTEITQQEPVSETEDENVIIQTETEDISEAETENIIVQTAEEEAAAELSEYKTDETVQTASEETPGTDGQKTSDDAVADETPLRKPFRKSKNEKNSESDSSQIEDLDRVFDIKSTEIESLTESEEEIMFGQYFNRTELSFEKVSADALFSEQTDQESNEIFASSEEGQEKHSEKEQAHDPDDDYPAFGLFSANGTSFMHTDAEEEHKELIQGAAEEKDDQKVPPEDYAYKETPQEDGEQHKEHIQDDPASEEETAAGNQPDSSDEEPAAEAGTEEESKRAKKRFFRKDQQEDAEDEFTENEFTEEERMHFSGDEPADDGSLLSKIKTKAYELRSSPNFGNIIKLAVASVVILGGLIVFTVSYRQKVNNYNTAVGFYQSGNFVDAKKILEKMVTFKDSNNLLVKCDQNLEVQYNHAMGLMVSKNYNEAADSFQKISGYSDATKQAIICKNRALYEEGEAFLKESKYSEAYLKFKELSVRGFEDSAARAEQCVRARPESNVYFANASYNNSGRAVINIVNPASNKCDIFVKMFSVNGDLIFTAYIREGENMNINISEGSYKANVAFGTKWFGNTGLFGSDKFGDLAGYYSYTAGEGNELITLIMGQNFEMSLKKPDDNDSVLKKIEPGDF